jgi:mono/diheme cytochrome c family protein
LRASCDVERRRRRRSAFGNAYSDVEIAAVANYVTARFGAKGLQLTAQDVAELRKQTAQ